MNTPRLYIKFFLTFLAIFIVTEILIFSFFHFVIGKKVAAHMADVNKYAVSSLIEDKLSRSPQLSPENNPQLKKLLRDLGRLYHARIWITENEAIICSSETPPGIYQRSCPPGMSIRETPPGRFAHNSKFFSAAIKYPDGRTAILHMALKRPPARPQDMTFALGLAGIGVIIALMLFPLYRFISKPLGELKDTAMGIASGDLSLRAPVRSSDEIGQLAKAFNTMADNVENMVKSTRELTANISHELRSPLARIRVAEELLEEKLTDPEKAKRYMESIRGETEEIDRLISDILRLSRLDTKTAGTSPKEFDLAEMLKNLSGRWNDSIEHASLKLDTHIPEENMPVNALPEDIQTALDNLIVNAIKFSPNKTTVSVSVEKQDRTAIIRIRNSCQPIAPADLEKIFEPFYRVKGNGSQGSGLGLTIARKIARNCGGDLTAVSWESGIEMILRIPLNEKK